MPLRRGYEPKAERKAVVKEVPEPLTFTDVPVTQWNIYYPGITGATSIVVYPTDDAIFDPTNGILDVLKEGEVQRFVYHLGNADWYTVQHYTMRMPEKKFVPTLALGGADPQAAI